MFVFAFLTRSSKLLIYLSIVFTSDNESCTFVSVSDKFFFKFSESSPILFNACPASFNFCPVKSFTSFHFCPVKSFTSFNFCLNSCFSSCILGFSGWLASCSFVLFWIVCSCIAVFDGAGASTSFILFSSFISFVLFWVVSSGILGFSDCFCLFVLFFVCSCIAVFDGGGACFVNMFVFFDSFFASEAFLFGSLIKFNFFSIKPFPLFI